ncbi:MAG: hypothetical protein GEU88_11630, partial [Solirubrobacterales bacterium]|nr:hypothetical protein [Solirubrobacterales bacterium]
MYPTRAFQLAAVTAMAICVLALTAQGATAAGGPAIPGGSFGGTGVTGPGPQPGSQFRYLAMSGRHETTIARIDTDGGRVDRWTTHEGTWALPAVTILGDAGGLSANGETLVLVHPQYRPAAERTRFLVLFSKSLRDRDRLVLDGRFSFDAISPDGTLLYLVEYADPRDPLDYRVRAYDLTTDEFRPGAVIDPDEPDEQMTGQPVSRRYSPDGRWAYTLYGGGEETFIHAL